MSQQLNLEGGTGRENIFCDPPKCLLAEGKSVICWDFDHQVGCDGFSLEWTSGECHDIVINYLFVNDI